MATQAEDVADAPKLPAKVPVQLEAQDGVRAILPTNLDEAQRYAAGIIRAGIVPEPYKHKQDVVEGEQLIHRRGDPNAPLILMGVLKAMEIGAPPQTGLAGLLPINDRWAVWGDLAVGLAQSKGLVANQQKRFVGPSFDPSTPLGEWPDEYGVVYSIWRRGQPDPYVGEFTVRDARRANLWLNTRKQPWIQYPNRMLFNRARAFALRDGFADTLQGLAIAEEALDFAPEPHADGGILTVDNSALNDGPVTDAQNNTAEELQGEAAPQ
jgi:hypothetical protein